MAERFYAIKLLLLFYAILLAGTSLRAQAIKLSEDAIDGLGQTQASKIAPEQKTATPPLQMTSLNSSTTLQRATKLPPLFTERLPA